MTPMLGINWKSTPQDMGLLRAFLLLLIAVLVVAVDASDGGKLPVVINTWPFVDANAEAVASLNAGGSYLDAIERGCSKCEEDQCDHSVGYGGSPNELGETTLDAMFMDAETHDVGAVGCLKNIKSAISVARRVMEYTEHTFLVGDDATTFATQMGFPKEDLHTDYSWNIFQQWKQNMCQPNYWIPGKVTPDPTSHCGPYKPSTLYQSQRSWHKRPPITESNHDTIGMIVVDADGKIGCGMTTNGANHKIPGRVGDSPIAGAGCYVLKGVGGAAATGDGDVMMRFLPTYQVVESMRRGMSPTAAAEDAIQSIAKYYPDFSGGLVAVNASGDYGAAGHFNFTFKYTVYNPTLGSSTVIPVTNIQ